MKMASPFQNGERLNLVRLAASPALYRPLAHWAIIIHDNSGHLAFCCILYDRAVWGIIIAFISVRVCLWSERRRRWRRHRRGGGRDRHSEGLLILRKHARSRQLDADELSLAYCDGEIFSNHGEYRVGVHTVGALEFSSSRDHDLPENG